MIVIIKKTQNIIFLTTISFFENSVPFQILSFLPCPHFIITTIWIGLFFLFCGNEQSFLGARTSPWDKHEITDVYLFIVVSPADAKVYLLNMQVNLSNIFLFLCPLDNCLIWDFFLVVCRSRKRYALYLILLPKFHQISTTLKPLTLGVSP